MDIGYGKPEERFWFSPNLRHNLNIMEEMREVPLTDNNFRSLDDLVPTVIAAIGFDWQAVQQEVVNTAAR